MQASKILTVIVFAIVCSSFSNVYAQTMPSMDSTNDCQIIMMSNLYTPFRIAISHDLTVKKTITDEKNDPESSLTLEGVDPNQAGIDPRTHLAFSSNSTDQWKITVNLDYKNENSSRTVIVDFYQDKDQQHILSQKLFSSGTHFCGIFSFHAGPAPHIPTSDEILALAGKIEEQKFAEHDQIILDTKESMLGIGKSASLIGLTAVVFIFVILVFNLSERRFLNKFNKRMLELSNEVRNSVQDVKFLAGMTDIYNTIERKKQQEQFTDHLMKLQDNFRGIVSVYMDDYMKVIIQYLNKIKPETQEPITIPEPPQLPEIVFSPPQPMIEQSSVEEKTDVSHPILDKILPKKQTNNLSMSPLERQVEEFKKPDYAGKLFDVYMETYAKIKDNPIPDSPEMIILEAIDIIIKENKGRWP